MYHPFPHLPVRFQQFILRLKSLKIHPKIIFFVLGILSTTWFLIRVVPKPSRAAYPCMQATAPYMSAFVLWLTGLGGTAFSFVHLRRSFQSSKYVLVFVFFVMMASFYLLSQYSIPNQSQAATTAFTKGTFPPNQPIGEAQGLFPGRVTWMWNSNATNENCDNTSNHNGVIDEGDNGWFMEANNDQMVIDSMLMYSLLSLSGNTSEANAWEDIFRHFNVSHGNGDHGYSDGEIILIKLNATTAYGAVGNRYYEDLSRNDDLSVNPFSAETNPYLVLSMLKQLVEKAGVPEEMIYIGDPARNIYKEFYELWYEEFPNIHYLGNNLIHTNLDINSLGRTPVAVTDNDQVFFADNGTVMPDAVSDKLFTIFEDMDYLINIPTMKAHSTAGMTLAAKNHFGSFTREWAMHLHTGLMANDDDPYRTGYGLYRVQTDIMMHELLSGKNLLMIVDGLYPGEAALGVPEKWDSSPFNGHWCSSIFLSLDPVAIESVCHDFLRTEYNGPTIPESRPNWDGVDDYLHQAADSSLWPDGIIYDPDNNGILISSLGVHEHWNDSINKQYSRNLEIGDGIELIKVHEVITGTSELEEPLKTEVFPNPALDFFYINNQEDQLISYQLITMDGRIVMQGETGSKNQMKIDISSLSKGTYLLQMKNDKISNDYKLIKQ